MTVYIDSRGHMVADSLEELHTFAKSIGLRREWFQDKRMPHYDVFGSMGQRALDKGAQLVPGKWIVGKSKEMK